MVAVLCVRRGHAALLAFELRCQHTVRRSGTFFLKPHAGSKQTSSTTFATSRAEPHLIRGKRLSENKKSAHCSPQPQPAIRHLTAINSGRVVLYGSVRSAKKQRGMYQLFLSNRSHPASSHAGATGKRNRLRLLLAFDIDPNTRSFNLGQRSPSASHSVRAASSRSCSERKLPFQLVSSKKAATSGLARGYEWRIASGPNARVRSCGPSFHCGSPPLWLVGGERTRQPKRAARM